MADAAKIREVVAAVVTQAIDAHILPLHDAIVDSVVQQLQPVLAADAGAATSKTLKNALASIQETVTQTDILRSLLDNAALFCARAALFVMRAGAAIGWQARGFENNDGIKILSVDPTSGLAAFALQQRTAVIGPAAQFDPRFVAGFGSPFDGNCLLVPMFVREKAAAFLCADAGTQPDAAEIDVAALELLVRYAGMWVELLSLRKAAGLPTPVPERAPASPPVMTAAAATTAPASPSPAPIVERAQATASPLPPQAPPPPSVSGVPHPEPGRREGEGWGSSPQPATVSAPAPPAPPAEAAIDEQELHRKARRFAKLLVDEIKLYNQAKLAQGKQNRDLYDRLKEDIEKSRATYYKRYGNTAAASTDYFSQELIRGLADNNPALLGSNFPR